MSSQLLRLLKQLADTLKEATGGTAVEDSVVEAEDKFGLHAGHERSFGLVPDRTFTTGHQPQNEVLLRQGNWARRGNAEGTNIGDRRDADAVRFRAGGGRHFLRNAEPMAPAYASLNAVASALPLIWIVLGAALVVVAEAEVVPVAVW